MDFHNINNQGKIWVQRVDDISLIGHTADDESRLVYSKSDDRIYIGTSTEWRVLAIEYSVIDQNSKMLFGSYPLPVGWNISNINDTMVSLTTATGSIGIYSGNWTITSIGQSDTHNHGGYTNLSTYLRSVRSYDAHRVTRPYYAHKHSILADGAHTHTFDGTWRPEYVKFCEAELQ
jgi:hypothetical protein